MAATEPIKSKAKLKEMADYYLDKGQIRNYTLIIMGVYTALRISDLLQLKWADVYDEERQSFYTHISLTEKKTGKTKTIALHKRALGALRQCLTKRKGDYIFSNNRKSCNKAISRVQAYRIVQSAAKAVGLEGKISCHSLRKTWGYWAWTSGDVSPVIIMHVYNHSDFAVTKRYLGIVQDDLDKAYLRIKLI